MLGVAREAHVVAVVPELQELRGTLSAPDARGVALANVARVGRVGADANAVQHLVSQRARSLIALVGSHANPSAVAAVGCSDPCIVVGRRPEVCDAGRLVPVAYQSVHGPPYAGIDVLVV